MSKYLNVLRECSKIAEEEYEEVSKKLKNLKKDLILSQNILDETISKLNKSDISDKNIYESIEKVNEETTNLLNIGFDDFEKSFQRKSKNLSDFTIALFGRTKAGKSTIREALTNGDGSTIGIGAQRTTRDVKVYKWNHLRILDTPGFNAYKGEEDEKIAFSQVDETDLILFLVTDDSIEESEFEKLATLRRENKPVIILLNVKINIKSHRVRREQLLKNPKKYVSMDAIQGHISRLKFLSKKYFDIHNIPIIPIHALAAFESNRAEGEEKKRLYKASNFKYFNNYIIKEIETSGKQKRVQTFRDSYIFHLENSIKPVYMESYRNLRIIGTLKKKQYELKRWFDRFIPDKNNEIEEKIKRLFDPIFEELDNFVDQNIEDPNFNDKWNKLVNNHITDKKIKDIQDDIILEMNRYLDRFFKEFTFDMSLSFSKISSENIDSIKKGSGGKVARWASATMGTASSVILSTAVANSWNPVGWGLASIGIGLGIFSWIWGDDTKRFNREKAKTKRKMRENLEKMKRKNRNALKNWFYRDITRGLKKKIKNDLYIQIKSFQKLSKEYSKIIKRIDIIIEKENISLIEKLLKLHNSNLFIKKVKRLFSSNKSNSSIESNIYKVARVQGVITKILVKNSFFDDDKDKKDFIKIYGERIIEVKNENDKIKFLLNALNINREDMDSGNIVNAFYSEGDKKFIIKVKNSIAGKIYGQNWINLRTAEKIIGNKIQVRVI